MMDGWIFGKLSSGVVEVEARRDRPLQPAPVPLSERRSDTTATWHVPITIVPGSMATSSTPTAALAEDGRVHFPARPDWVVANEAARVLPRALRPPASRTLLPCTAES